MKKINKKAFALMEILIVSVFVSITFTLLYTNVLPLIGAYESYENYDTVDTKYNAYYMRRFITGGYVNSDELINNTNKIITKSSCTNTALFNSKAMCKVYFNRLRIDSLIFTNFSTETIKGEDLSDKGLKKYIDYLPKYNVETGYSAKQGLYRIIIKMHNNDQKTYYYGTIEVEINE